MLSWNIFFELIDDIPFIHTMSKYFFDKLFISVLKKLYKLFSHWLLLSFFYKTWKCTLRANGITIFITKKISFSTAHFSAQRSKFLILSFFVLILWCIFKGCPQIGHGWGWPRARRREGRDRWVQDRRTRRGVESCRQQSQVSWGLRGEGKNLFS